MATERWKQDLQDARRSCLVTINNATDLTLLRTTHTTTAGNWAKEPPEVIHPNTKVEFGSLGASGLQGTIANVNYKAIGYDGEFSFSWRNPKLKGQTNFCFVPPPFQITQMGNDEKFSQIRFEISKRK